MEVAVSHLFLSARKEGNYETNLSCFFQCYAVDFLLWVFSITNQRLTYDLYPSLSVFSARETFKYENVKTELDKLAEENKSLIGRMMQASDENSDKNIRYDLYGQGRLPQGLNKAKDSTSRSSSLVVNYYNFNGSLKSEERVIIIATHNPII